MSKSLRDEIRKALLGKKQKSKRKIVKFNEVEIEVRQISIADRKDYLNKTIDKNTMQPELLKLQVYGIIASCYIPDSDEKVFEDTDYNVISDSVTGGYADVLWQAVQELSNFTVEEAKKN